MAVAAAVRLAGTIVVRWSIVCRRWREQLNG